MNETQQLHFNAAKDIALTIKKGHKRRACYNNEPVNYMGYKAHDGRMFVIGDGIEDLPNCNGIWFGVYPAIEVYN